MVYTKVCCSTLVPCLEDFGSEQMFPDCAVLAYISWKLEVIHASCYHIIILVFLLILHFFLSASIRNDPYLGVTPLSINSTYTPSRSIGLERSFPSRPPCAPILTKSSSGSSSQTNPLHMSAVFADRLHINMPHPIQRCLGLSAAISSTCFDNRRGKPW